VSSCGGQLGNEELMMGFGTHTSVSKIGYHRELILRTCGLRYAQDDGAFEWLRFLLGDDWYGSVVTRLILRQAQDDGFLSES
jgi:hypothetical protein